MLIRAAEPRDAEAIAEIYNQGIEDGAATFETRPREPVEVLAWIEAADRRPVLVATDADGRVIGWAAVSAYRPRECYAGIGEYSIYMAREARGRGMGQRLLAELVDAAASRGYWKLLSRVFPENGASLRLARACGFREVGIYEKHGKLNGRWTDVVIVERLIEQNLD